MPDFPSELVEAAAVVCYSLAPEHDTSTYPHGYVPYDEARPSSRENARADALEVLTAFYPRIEQRVIDRLAREAGEGDLGEDLCDAFAHHSMPLWERAQITDAVHAVAARWVACGVAAERARWEDARSLLEVIARASDPGSENASDEAWRFAYENASESAAQVLAALAPERTREGNDA